MPEQPQWPERTLDMPPQDPWADPPTTDMPSRPGPHQGGPRGPQQGGPRGPQQGGPRGHQETRVWGAQDHEHPSRTADGTAPLHPGSAPPHQGTAPLHPGSAPPHHGTAPLHPGSAPPHPGAGAAQQPPSPFTSGRASVNPRPRPQEPAAEHEPTGTGWPGADAPRQQRPLGWHLEQLRRGGEWSFAGLLFAFVCWGIWAISSGGDLTTPVIVFLVSVLVAAGVFALSRLIGRLVWERQLGRERHTAKGAHIVAGLFLVGVGIAHLQQTEWVMTAFNWVADLFR